MTISHPLRATLLTLLCVGMVSCSSGPTQPSRYVAKVEDAPVPQPLALDKIAKVNVDLAANYYSAGQFGTAAEVIGLALAAEPNNVAALGLNGLIQTELNDIPRARSSFEKALAINAQDPDLNHNYGAFLCKTGDPAKSIVYFRAALEVPTYTRSANTLAAAGNCLARIQRNDEALQYFTAALRFEPAHAPTLIGMADLQYRTGAIVEASDLMSRFARVSRASAESLWLQVRIARKLGRQDDERMYSSDLRNTFASSDQARQLDLGQFN